MRLDQFSLELEQHVHIVWFYMQFPVIHLNMSFLPTTITSKTSAAFYSTSSTITTTTLITSLASTTSTIAMTTKTLSDKCRSIWTSTDCRTNHERSQEKHLKCKRMCLTLEDYKKRWLCFSLPVKNIYIVFFRCK